MHNGNKMLPHHIIGFGYAELGHTVSDLSIGIVVIVTGG